MWRTAETQQHHGAEGMSVNGIAQRLGGCQEHRAAGCGQRRSAEGRALRGCGRGGVGGVRELNLVDDAWTALERGGRRWPPRGADGPDAPANGGKGPDARHAQHPRGAGLDGDRPWHRRRSGMHGAQRPGRGDRTGTGAVRLVKRLPRPNRLCCMFGVEGETSGSRKCWRPLPMLSAPAECGCSRCGYADRR